MRLDFNVLWVDDQPHNVSGYQESFERKVRSEGFKLNVTPAKSLDEAMPHLTDDVFTDNIDLVVVDYDLGASTTGNLVVEEVRRKVAYKDIVFYSARTSADLKQMMASQGVEGVWCAHRTSLSTTLEELFESLVKKVLDIDHCRGIVMGVTSDIDYLVIECLLNLSTKIKAEHNESAASYVLKIFNERLVRFQETRDTFAATMSIQQLLADHEAFPAEHRLGLLKKILTLHYEGQHSALRKEVGKYANEVPKKRNELGHVRLVAAGGKRVLRGREKAVTSDELKEFRQLLIDYRDKFDEIATLLGVSFDGLSDALTEASENPT